MPPTLPAGAVRIDKFYGYLWEKVINHPEFGTGWVKVHHLVWWKHRHQRIIRGYVLHHKDDDKTHNHLHNLKLLTRAAHAKLHGTGRKISEETRAKMKGAASARCTAEWSTAVSKRVKKQHEALSGKRLGWKY